MLQILVVDDDVELCELVAEYLEPDGYKVEAVHDGQTGLERALSGDHALAVLDYMLPGLNGFELLKQIRNRSRLPVVMLTARGDAVSRIVGLQMGADDYIPKPFDPLELLARINAVLRRALPEPDSGALAVGDIEMDHRTRTVKRDGETVELTLVEYSILEKLLSAAGTIVKREELVRDVLHRALSPFGEGGAPIHQHRVKAAKGEAFMSEYQDSNPTTTAGTPRWVGLAVAVLGALSLLGLGVGCRLLRDQLGLAGDPAPTAWRTGRGRGVGSAALGALAGPAAA